MRILKLLHDTENKLSAANIENPRHDAEYIISESLGIRITELRTLPPDTEIPESKIEEISRITEKRKRHEPLQYIFGVAYFRALSLIVGPGVLIPRPETEILVQAAIDSTPEGGYFCDIGTGSGAIALSAAFERPDLNVTATDISEKALSYARKNKQKYNLANLKLIESDLFANIDKLEFDTITANLPYIAGDIYNALPAEVKLYEPENALEGGSDGLSVIKRLIKECPEYLKNGGNLFLEISPEQNEKMKEPLEISPFFSKISLIKDFNKRYRVVCAKKSC